MPKTIMPTGPAVVLDAQSADEAEGIFFIKGTNYYLSVALLGDGVTSSGVITIEEAYYEEGGTPPTAWSLLGTVNASDVSQGVQKISRFVGSHWVVRVRITTEVGGGGTVTAVVWAN